MPFAMEQLSQGLAVLARIDPVSQGAGNVLSVAIDMSRVRRLMAVVQVGSVGASGTVDAQLKSSATSGGSYANVSGTAITQITVNNKVATIEIRDDQLAAGQQFVKLSIDVGANAVLIAAVVLGGDAEYKPAKSQDIAQVAQRLVL